MAACIWLDRFFTRARSREDDTSTLSLRIYKSKRQAMRSVRMVDDSKFSSCRGCKTREKMIEVSLRFWTNNISSEPGKIVPKNAWTAGVVRIQGNESHGIVSGNPKPFHSLLAYWSGYRGGATEPRHHAAPQQAHEKVHGSRKENSCERTEKLT